MAKKNPSKTKKTLTRLRITMVIFRGLCDLSKLVTTFLRGVVEKLGDKNSKYTLTSQ